MLLLIVNCAGGFRKRNFVGRYMCVIKYLVRIHGMPTLFTFSVRRRKSLQGILMYIIWRHVMLSFLLMKLVDDVNTCFKFFLYLVQIKTLTAPDITCKYARNGVEYKIVMK